MKTSNVLAKYNVLTKIIVNENVDKDIKIRIMKARIEYAKIKNAFDTDLKTCLDSLITPEFENLRNMEDRTDEENQKLIDLTNSINEDYSKYIKVREQDEVTCNDIEFTPEEFNQLLEANIDNNVTINEHNIDAASFIEIIYELFVNK